MVDIRVVFVVLIIIPLLRKKTIIDFCVVFISQEQRLLHLKKHLIVIFVVIKWPDI